MTAAERPRWGQIWAFCDPAGVVEVHRCVGRRDGRSRFWGDGNATADPLVPDAVLVGRVVAVQSPGGRYRRAKSVGELATASCVGLRRLPRRLWYSRHDLVRRTTRERGGDAR
ncbi:MAG TPA: hypothetical protein VGP92_08325 [Acidimicrobiia bacterium]|nr:hypothetical protein [Acidimicrobiia bacterium]